MHSLNVSTNGSLLIVFPIEVDEYYEENDQEENTDGGHDGRDQGGGLQAVRGDGQRGGPPLGVAGLGLLVQGAGGGVGEVALLVVPLLPQSVRPVTAVTAGFTPQTPEVRGPTEVQALATAGLGDAGGPGGEGGHGPRVDHHVVNVDLAVQM